MMTTYNVRPHYHSSIDFKLSGIVPLAVWHLEAEGEATL